MKKVLIRIENNILNVRCKKFPFGTESKNFFFFNLINKVCSAMYYCMEDEVHTKVHTVKIKDHRDSYGSLKQKSSKILHFQAFYAAPPGLEPGLF